MYKKILYTLFLSLALVFSACGSNEKEDGFSASGAGGTDTSVKITSSIQTMAIDKSSGNFSANITIFSGYVGDVTLTGLKSVLNDCKLVPASESSDPTVVTLVAGSKSKEVKITGTLVDPSCVPSSYSLSGEQSLNGTTNTTPFNTKNTTIPNSLISSENLNNLKLEVLDKRIDMNETSILKPIRLRVIKGKVGAKNKKIKLMTAISSGSMHANVVETDTSGDAIFNYTSPAIMVDENMTVKFCLEEDLAVCDTMTIILTTSKIVPPIDLIDDINYLITFKPKGGANNLQVGSRNNAIVSLIDKDTQKAIPSNRIKSITVSSKDTSVLKLTPEGGGEPSGSLNIKNRNDIAVLLTADERNAGLAIIQVIIEYTNRNGVPRTRGQLFAVSVLSGPATAFTINSTGISYDAVEQWFSHGYKITAVDKYGNKINTKSTISVSVMAGYSKDNNGERMTYGKYNVSKASGILKPVSGKASLELVGLSPFDSIDQDRDFVAVFGDVKTYEANGKWDIESIDSSNTLSLRNKYYGGEYKNLGIAVGHNYRQELCSETYAESTVIVDSSNGKYQLDEHGEAKVNIKFPPYMVGKKVLMLVNSISFNPTTGKTLRAGEVKSIALNSFQGIKGTTISVKKGTNKSVRLSGTILTGSEDSFALLDSTFHCGTRSLNNIRILEEKRNEIGNCNESRAYIDFKLTTENPEEDGTLTLGDCFADSEFRF